MKNTDGEGFIDLVFFGRIIFKVSRLNDELHAKKNY